MAQLAGAEREQLLFGLHRECARQGSRSCIAGTDCWQQDWLLVMHGLSAKRFITALLVQVL